MIIAGSIVGAVIVTDDSEAIVAEELPPLSD